MDCFETMLEMGHEQVVWCHDRDTGLRAIIAIHDTTLGPALGGCRFMDYPTERDALVDVLRLSRGMTYKAAVAGLDLGGGKSVIIGTRDMRTEALFRAFGRFVDSLGGRYVTAEDMNTTEREMGFIRRETQHVTGISPALGGAGDPGPVTAWGCYQGICAALKMVFGDEAPAGRTVAIQGVGSVGLALAGHLHEAGANLVYSDIDEANVARAVAAYGGTAVGLDEFYAVPCDVLSPCAVGAVLNPDTIGRIVAPIVAGSANNQLADEPRDAEALRQRGIAYVTDYVINAGGLIHVFGELRGWPRSKSMNEAERIYDTVQRVLAVADAEGITTLAASDRIAEDRLASAGKVLSVRRPA